MTKSTTLRKFAATTVAALVAIAAFAAGGPNGFPANSPAAGGATITPNYKDADLGQIIQAVSEVTGKNFIVDPRVNAKVTMLSSTPMSPAAFYEAFLSVLQVYGYVAVPAGKVIKIMPNTDARQLPSIDLPERHQRDLGRDRHADHDHEERQRRAARTAAAPADPAAGTPRRLSGRQHADHLRPQPATSAAS